MNNMIKCATIGLTCMLHSLDLYAIKGGTLALRPAAAQSLVCFAADAAAPWSIRCSSMRSGHILPIPVADSWPRAAGFCWPAISALSSSWGRGTCWTKLIVLCSALLQAEQLSAVVRCCQMRAHGRAESANLCLFLPLRDEHIHVSRHFLKMCLANASVGGPSSCRDSPVCSIAPACSWAMQRSWPLRTPSQPPPALPRIVSRRFAHIFARSPHSSAPACDADSDGRRSSAPCLCAPRTISRC